MSWAQRDTSLQKKKLFYLHSRSNKNRLVIQIQKALWRKLEPLFSRNKMLYASKTEVRENALAVEGKSPGGLLGSIFAGYVPLAS